MNRSLRSFLNFGLGAAVLALVGACGTEAAPQPLPNNPNPDAQQPAPDNIARNLTVAAPGAINLKVTPRLSAVPVDITVMYYSTAVSALGDSGVQKKAASKAAPAIFALPSVACLAAITTTDTVGGKKIEAGLVPQGIQLKVDLKSGLTAGIPGRSPHDNELVTVEVNGEQLGALPEITYTGGSTIVNLFIQGILGGCQ